MKLARRKLASASHEEKLLQLTLGRLRSFEGDTIERLTRVEENLRLLRQELVGNGRPGRIAQLEGQVDQLRADHQRQQGIFAGVCFVVSLAGALLARLLPF